MSIQEGDLIRPNNNVMVTSLARHYGLSMDEVRRTTFRAVVVDAAYLRVDVVPLTQPNKVFEHRNTQMFERI